MDTLGSFFSRIKDGPAVLFLGQKYLSLGTGFDPFLSEFRRKYGGEGEQDYFAILSSTAVDALDSSLPWLDELSRRISAPEWLKKIAQFPWSSVYSSAIDSMWVNVFRTPWRTLQPVFDEKFHSLDPRNRFILHCHFLFGCVNRLEENERPPFNRLEYLTRKQTAVSLARRIPGTTTPFGCVAIEGYHVDDWFTLDDLLPVIDQLDPEQVYLFSASEAFEKHPLVATLVRRRKLTLVRERLDVILARGQELGFVRLGLPPEAAEGQRYIAISTRNVLVPTEVWNQTSRSATILDSSIIAPTPPPRISKEAEYSEFRRFLSESGFKATWAGFARGFAFERRFERALRGIVDHRLEAYSLQDRPVILHGQTGTGKTIALGSLAYSIARQGKYPVLFIERRSDPPAAGDIDRFCKWAEDNGASATLVVWDGMREPHEYAEFLRSLTSRGRKALLLGSTYRLTDIAPNSRDYVEAPPNLAEEAEEFARFLKKFLPSLDGRFVEMIRRADDTFLTALYRLIPPTRPTIRRGVGQEVDYSEQIIMALSGKIRARDETLPLLGQLLGQAGLLTYERLVTDQEDTIGRERFTEVQELIGLVMVPGRFGLKVTIELLLRALGKPEFLDVRDVLEKVDLFRWYEDTVGRISLGPRHPIEAQIIVKSRIGDPRTEVAFVNRLLLEVEEYEYGSPESSDLIFAFDLLDAVGPQGSERSYYSPHWKDIAKTLKRLREERGVRHPRLMFREVNYLREWAAEQEKRGSGNGEIRGALSEAEHVLRQALELIPDERKSVPFKFNLYNELAALMGSRILLALHEGRSHSDLLELFNSARDAISRARALNPLNFYPVDVLSWVSLALIGSEMLENHERAEVSADLLHALQTLEESELDPAQLERLYRRRLEVGDQVGAPNLSEEAFQALVRQGSTAGYFLRASRMVGDIRRVTSLQEADAESLRGAVEYLDQNRQAIAKDVRCLDLLLELWWLRQTGGRLLTGERRTLPLSEVNWRYLLGLIEDLEQNPTHSFRQVVYLFLKGLALLHLGQVGAAISAFRDVERESHLIHGRRRVIRTYVASTPDGAPRLFHGTVAWVDLERGRGELYVDELRQRITFIPRDFARAEVRRGESLGDFHLAFNFLGPIADPPELARRASPNGT